MSATIDTIVQCDDCGEQCSGDDRHLPAYRIREQRRRVGWIQIGSRDYCEKCAPKHKTKKKAKP